MSSGKVRWAAVSAALIFAAACVGTAQAQVRTVQAPPPSPPRGIQKPAVDPTHQAIAALGLKLDALRQSAGRQVVVLHFPATDANSWPESDNSFPANSARGESMCKAALGDRYGRVLSRQAQPMGDRWYFPNVVCETAP